MFCSLNIVYYFIACTRNGRSDINTRETQLKNNK